MYAEFRKFIRWRDGARSFPGHTNKQDQEGGKSFLKIIFLSCATNFTHFSTGIAFVESADVANWGRGILKKIRPVLFLG